MAFIYESSSVVSFAEYQDVYDRDQKIFDSHEGLTDDAIETVLKRATQRILVKLRATDWWKSYYVNRTASTYRTLADIPALDIDRIKDRQSDFTDLCVYTALGEFILPSIADFGNPDNAERQKMGYYVQKASNLFAELVTAGDWYDFDDDGSIESTEKEPGRYNLKRVR